MNNTAENTTASVTSITSVDTTSSTSVDTTSSTFETTASSTHLGTASSTFVATTSSTFVANTSSTSVATSPTGIFPSLVSGCESLVGKGLTLSSTNNTTWSVVHVDCDEFGHRPSGGISQLICLNTSKWDQPIPKCEWSWDLTMQEKIIFGTAVAAVSFIIVIVIAIFIAYFCCYVKRKQEDDKIYDSSYHGSSPKTGYDGHYQGRESYPITYLAYQDINDGKYDNNAHTGTLDKPWLGYIPRPKVTECTFYN